MPEGFSHRTRRAEGGNRDSSARRVAINVWLRAEDFHQVKDRAIARKRSISSTIAEIVEKALKHDPNP